ncbi:MAG: DNA-directed DNA polymerase [uncultured bacterium]|nr:MAG: DNA-directed DNA polymerase [uncultured bacterium]
MDFINFEFDKGIDWGAVEKEAEEEIKEAKKEREINFAVIDAETDPFNGEDFVEPFIWGFFDGSTYIKFDGPYATDHLIDYVGKYRGRVFAHNGGKFDFHFLIEAFEKEKSLTVINGRIAKARLGRATLQDSYCLLPVPLSALEKDQFDYSILEKGKRNLPGNKEKIEKYLESDCRYLYKYVKEFVDSYGMNLTLAGTAMKQWEKMGGKVPKSNKKYYDKFLPHYYGGRVQLFESGIFEGEYKIYDIKSAYPTAMKYHHPIGTDYYETRRPGDALLQNSMISVECISNGAFPMRTRNGLFFPQEKGIYHVTGWEFIKAIETNSISNHKILNAYVFEETCDFSMYVDHFYKMKSEAEAVGDTAKRTFAKLFLNSLYGKFAANPENYEEFYLDDYGAYPKDDYAPAAVYGDMQLFARDLPEDKWKFFNIVTAASITGWVRAYLWESIQKCEGVLYCDTDSIICRNGDALPLGKELGNWDLEGTAHKVAIAGKKLYACFLDTGKTKIACKGVRISADEIVKVAQGETIVYRSEAELFSLKGKKRFIERKVNATSIIF